MIQKKKSGSRKGKGKTKKQYICYTGIGSNKTGTHTAKDFLKRMEKNRNNFNEPTSKSVKTLDQWVKNSGASYGKCSKSTVKEMKSHGLPIKFAKKMCRKECKESEKQMPLMMKTLGLNKKEVKEKMKTYKKDCEKNCVRLTTDEKLMKQLLKMKLKGGCGKRGGGKKKKTIRKSKLGSGVYLEFRSGSSRKFWRIVKNGTKLTTHYGKIGSLGNMTKKDYGSKVDQEYDKLIKSKKKKGYVEKIDFGDPNPKKPTKIEREYMKICKKAEQNKKLNPNQVSYDCDAMLDQGESELKWQIQWNKDALKKGDFDWDKYKEHNKKKRKK